MRSRIIFLFLLVAPLLLRAQSARILINQVGYEQDKTKRAIIQTNTRETIAAFQLIDDSTNKTVYAGKPVYSGAVANWKHWQFYTLDFTACKKPGVYRLQASIGGRATTSYPFVIGKNVFEKATLSDILYYFKGQRSAGLIDQADHHLPLPAAAHNPAVPDGQ
ncbi:MAG TPA: cellulase N-terminal Ig-like domain-containing protein, partial [Puia sp.]|nr:cellulase N-terminal Ig-like domain-containing protein [Puia sp.]